MYGLKKRPKDESGLIQGAGTGTSDDVKKNVPAGSYIMPADSTQKIGTDNLKNMGNPTPVNLSNGEFQLSPDQVHSVGVQALDAMKNQTHTPVDQPQLGFKPGQNKPELFFANGGLVPDEEWLKQRSAPKTFAQNMSQNIPKSTPNLGGESPFVQRGQPYKTPTPQAKPTVPQQKQATSTSVSNQPSSSGFGAFAKNMVAPSHDDGSWNPVGGLVNTITGLGGAALGTSGGLVAGAGEAVRSTAATLGSANNPNRGNLVAPSFDFAGDSLNQAKLGVRQMFGLTPKDSTSTPTSTNTTPPPATKSAPTAQVAEKAKADAAAKVAASTTPPTTDLSQQNTKQPISMFTDTSIQNTAQATDNPYAIQQNGNSFSYANPQAAAAARAAGVPELQSSGIQTGQGIRGIKEFMANTREMGASDQQIQDALARREMNIGMQGRAGIPRELERPTLSDEEKGKRDALARQINSAINPKYGPTAKQAEMLLQLSSDNPNALDVYKTDANNAAALQREAMGQAGQNYRTELNEQGTNNRYNSGLNLEAQKFNATNDLANRQFSAEQLDKMPARMKQQVELNLLQQYDAAQTDEERKPILERLNLIRGQSQQQGKVKAVYGGQTLTEQGAIRNPDILVDESTGRQIDYGAGQAQQIPQAAIEHLRKNPNQATYFDEMFGKGSAARYLG